MSNQIIELQRQIGVKADGDFGPNTLRAMMLYYKLTKEQAAHFAGQCSHESGEFKVFVENLNYTADGLMKTFKKYFPTKALADQYARKPQAIANRVYANRMGNGDEGSGDGWKFRGRSAIQSTGRSNYTALSKYLGDPTIITNPDQVELKYAFQAAKFFFDSNKLWSLCNVVNDQSIKAVTLKINGGTNGLDHRIALTKKYYGWLK